MGRLKDRQILDIEAGPEAEEQEEAPEVMCPVYNVGDPAIMSTLLSGGGVGIILNKSEGAR